MPTLTLAALRKEIAAGATGPLYLLTGPDEEEKAAVAAEFAEMVDEGLHAFNVDRLHGGEMTVDDLVHAASTFPMMAPRRLVMVLHAERLMVPKRESKAADEELERLEAFILAPPGHATVVFVCGALDMRFRLPKLLAREARVVSCGTIESPEDAERWVKARAARDGVPLDASAARALVQRAGVDIGRLRAGLERVQLYALGQTSIVAADVMEAVSAAPEEQENFGIANAIARGDASEALNELHLALDSGAAAFFVLGQIRVAAERVSSARLPMAMDALLRTDLALKQSLGDERVLLERLVVELCAPQRVREPRGSGWRSGASR